jgi:hypothetical protein
MLHRFNNGEHLKVRDPVVAFCRYALAGEKGDGVPARIVQLAEDARDGKSGGIGMKTNREIGVEVTEDWGRGESALELVKGFLSLRRPFKALILAEEGGDRGSDAGITVNEAAVEVSEAQEYLNILDAGGNRPFCDGSNTVWLHRDAFGRDDEAEEGDGGCVKFAFTELARQTVLTEP